MATQTVYFNNPQDITNLQTNVSGLQTNVSTLQQQTNSFPFSAVPYSVADQVIIPSNYSYSTVVRCGDAISSTGPVNIAKARFDGSESPLSYWGRAGDRADGIYYYALSGSSTEGLLVCNHEIMTITYLHTGGFRVFGLDGTTGSVYSCYRPYNDCVKEMLALGISVSHIKKNPNSGVWEPQLDSRYNKRYTPFTEFDVQGPLRGSTYLQTKFSPDGTKVLGTLDNCGASKTPWGTYLSAEENVWYFHMSLGGEASVGRTAEELAALRRYRIDCKGSSSQCNVFNNTVNKVAGYTGPADLNFQISATLWASATGYASDPFYGTQYMPTGCFDMFNIFAYGATPTDDYRNVLNGYYMIKEIDPFNPSSTPIARSALGRFLHENSCVAPAVPGQKITLYMNCDSRNEYMYKYVSEKAWDAADANGGLAAGSKYLNTGTLYVAKMSLTGTLGTPYGTGAWINLNTTNGTSSYGVTVNSLEKACLWTRCAADINAASFTDRTEWSAVDPRNNIVYQSFTNNRDRRITGATYNITSAISQGNKPIDALSPRAYNDYNDTTGVVTDQGNLNGGIFRYQCYSGGVANTVGTEIRWDHFLFGCGPEKLADNNVNLSKLDDSNAFSMPDTCCFGEYSGQKGWLWICTDDGYITNYINCSVSAVYIPTGAYVGDGKTITVSNTVRDANGYVSSTKDVITYVGAKRQVSRFLTGVNGCEITGWTETPDGTTAFTAIQHPGEVPTTFVESLTQVANKGFDLAAAQASSILAPTGFDCNFPDGKISRPRSTVIAISRRDGQPIV